MAIGSRYWIWHRKVSMEQEKTAEEGARGVLGAMLRETRLASGVGQKELARRTNTSQTLISNYELGKQEPSYPIVVRLLAGMDMVAEVHAQKVAPADWQDMSWYEHKATKISSQISTYVKEVGGYNTELGGKFSWLLHEFNGALGNAYNLIAAYKYRLARLECTAVEGTPADHRYGLAKRIAEYRIEQTGVKDGWANPKDSDFKLADQIIKDGWTAPSEAKVD